MSRNNPQIHRLLVGLLGVGLSLPALAQSVQFPKYTPGAQTNGSFIVASGQVITPAGTYINLGITTRAKAIALNPTGDNTAAVLQMGAPQVITIFSTKTGLCCKLSSRPPARAAALPNRVKTGPKLRDLNHCNKSRPNLSYIE